MKKIKINKTNARLIIELENILRHKPDKKKIAQIEKDGIAYMEAGKSANKLVALRIPDWFDMLLRVEAEKDGITYSDHMRRLLMWPYLPKTLLVAMSRGMYTPSEKDREKGFGMRKPLADFYHEMEKILHLMEWVTKVTIRYDELDLAVEKFLSGEGVKIVMPKRKAKKKKPKK